MARVELLLPKLGESITDATILKWLKKPGDHVELDEPIVEIATDKVDSEVPSTHEGVLTEALHQEGDVVEVGKVLAVIETDAAAELTAPAAAPPEVQKTVESPPPPPAPAAPTPTPPEPVAEPIGRPQAEPVVTPQPAEVPFVPAAQHVEQQVSNGSGNGRSAFYSPLVMKIAQQEGLSIQELSSIRGTGHMQRVTKKDVLAYIKRKSSGQLAAPAPAPVSAVSEAQVSSPVSPPSSSRPSPVQAPVSSGGQDDRIEVIEMDRMRKMIAENMIASKHTSAHVTSFVEADVTRIVHWRNKWKKKFQEREGEKLTFTPIFIEALVRAIKDFPMINVSVDGSRILRKKFINMGMATALPNGNLIVPVIHEADQLSLVGLAKRVNDLASRARINKLKPDEIQGGTYTISNVGGFGNLMGTPIIPQPQVAIMAVGSIKKKPVVIDTDEGEHIAVRHMMFLSHTYDHRVVDGMLGGMFVRKVADYLENFDINREI